MANHNAGYPSVDRPWMKYYEHLEYDLTIPDETIFQTLERRCADRLDDIALEMLPEAGGLPAGVTITYGEYIARIRECAKALSCLGVRPGQIVSTLLPNIPESRIAIYAISAVGATAYPMSPMLPTTVFEDIVRENGIGTVICFTSFLEKFGNSIAGSGMPNVVTVNGDESLRYQLQSSQGSGLTPQPKPPIEGAVSWEEAIARAESLPEIAAHPFETDHVAAVIGTSGTTGTPKGVCLTDRNLNALAIGQETSDHYRPGEKAMDALTQFIGYGISTAHSLSCIGCHTVLIPRLVTTDFPKLLCEVKPDIFPGGPVHYINLVRSDEFKNGKVPPVRIAFSGGASLDAVTETALNGVGKGHHEKAGDRIIARQGYGSTECCGAATACTYGAYLFGSIGIPMTNVDVAIFKPGTDEELPYNTEGEICVSGPSVMLGYLNNPEETSRVLKRHGDGRIWLHQADLGWCDESGHIFITDRIKNIFMRIGFNIHPSKIAEFVRSIPGVAECAVVGAPHPEEQAVPVAFVVPSEPDGLPALKARILTECRANLEELSIPYDIAFVSKLPINIGGKVDTVALLKRSEIDYESNPEPIDRGLIAVDE